MEKRATDKMKPCEFRELGFLQEINRLFLHPRGLSLEIVVDEHGEELFGMVQDFRGDESGGVIFSDKNLSSQSAEDKAKYVADCFATMSKIRLREFNYVVQPIKE